MSMTGGANLDEKAGSEALRSFGTAARPAGIQLRNVNHWFGLAPGSRTQPVHVLKDLTLDIEPGTFVCVVGPSGSGKTTLLRIMNGLCAPTDGEVLVRGEKVTGRPPSNVAMVFQHHNLLPWRRVLANTAFGLELDGVPAAECRERASKALEVVGLDRFKSAYPHQLSGGMAQRVGLARALAIDPEILLMDEPFGALDEQTRELLQAHLLQIWEADRKTCVFITHSIEEAIYLGDRVIVMSSQPGRIVADVVVDLPRPRQGVEVTMTSDVAGRYRREVTRLLRAGTAKSDTD